MEFRDALKLFRSEVGIAQTDVAAALHVNITTVARWELGKTIPNRSFGIALLDYAKIKSATGKCIDNLEKSLSSATRQKLFSSKNSLFTVEHATISQLIEDAAFPIYVCTLDTDEILYANHATEQLLETTLDELAGKKCYECIMHRDKPCEFCRKNQLVEDGFSGYEAFRRFDGNYYRVLGKLAKWSGHPAQVRYVFALDGSVQIASRNELRLKYDEQLAIRRESVGNALAVAHYNLTHGTVSQLECQDETIAARLVSGRYEDVISALSENIFSAEEKIKLDSIRDRNSLIKCFFQGKTHISIKHRIKGLPGYYEGTFDLMQNPVTYDIEAFAVLRDLTDKTVSDAVIDMILHTDFDNIMTIDAATGEAHAYRGKHIDEIVKEQQRLGDYVAGVETYLRRHCADKDIERVIRQTSVPYVKEQLQTKPVLTVAYSLRDHGQLIYKQAQFSYLDEEQTTILCVTQNISEACRQLATKESPAGLPKQNPMHPASEHNMGEQ